MKKFFRLSVVCIALMLCFVIFAACGEDTDGGGNNNNNNNNNANQSYSTYALDELIAAGELVSHTSSQYSDVVAAYGTTVSVSLTDKVMKFNGSAAKAFNPASFTTDEDGKVTFSGNVAAISEIFNNVTVKPGILKFGATFSGVSFSFNYFNDDLIAEHSESFTLGFTTGGSEVIAPVTRKEGERLDPPEPERLGHSFNMWYKDNGGSSSPLRYKRMPGEDLTLRATFTCDFKTELQFGTPAWSGLSASGQKKTVLYMPNNVNGTKISEWTAWTILSGANENLEEITFDPAHSSIPSTMGINSWLANLKRIILLRDGVVSCSNVSSFPKGALIYVPANRVEAYKASSQWATAADRIFAIAE